MGKKTGFIDYPRTNFTYLPVQTRIKHFKEFTKIQPKTEVQNQAARCMDCGTPYCSWACPVDNKMPEFNDFVYRGLWQKAYENLTSTNNFPEFTGRICPAPCEPACCTVLVNSAVTIKQIELATIEKVFSLGRNFSTKNKDNYKRIKRFSSYPNLLLIAHKLGFRHCIQDGLLSQLKLS